MAGTSDRLPLWVALGLSIVSHLVIVGPLLHELFTSDAQAAADTALNAPLPDNKREIYLGIEQPTRAATLTWIGYEQYEEHIARLSETEQAAMTSDPAGTQRTPNNTPSPQPDQDQKQTLSPKAPSPPGMLARDAQKPESSAVVLALPKLIEEFGLTMQAEMVALAQQLQAMADQQPAEQPKEPDKRVAQQAEPQPAQPPQPVKPVPDAPAQPEPPEKTKESDTPSKAPAAKKDAAATTRIEIAYKEIDPGKPIAAEGIELFPKKPKYDRLTRFTALPGRTDVEIYFDSRGIAIRAAILRSSGNADVDNAIHNSLYQWFARGELVTSLADEAAHRIFIEIIP